MSEELKRKTSVAIEGRAFHVNGRPTYEGRSCRGMKVEGLLMNSRMVQGIFDDLNPRTRRHWDYPDGSWDPERNTEEFIRAMPAWRDAGLVGFTINLQGGSPHGPVGSKTSSGRRGLREDEKWHNSAFEPDGALRQDYMRRLERVLDRADDLGMVPILGYFYFGQDWRFPDDETVVRAAETATDWLLRKGYTNVIVEAANEVNVKYTRDIIKTERCHELIRLVAEMSAGGGRGGHLPAGRLLVGTSMGGGSVPPENIVRSSDFLLLHGNGVKRPDRIREMVRECRARGSYRDQPVLFNEDDHFDFDAEDNNMLAAVSQYAGWGLYDFRMEGEGYEAGFQSVPVNWGISSERKRGFFRLLAEMTGGNPPA